MVIIDEKLLEKNYYIRKTDHPDKVYSASLLDIQQKEKMDDFVKFYGEKIKATNVGVVATYFCTYYGWALAGLQRLLSLDFSLSLSLSNTELQIYYDQERKHYDLAFKLNENLIQPCIHKEEWLEEVYEKNVTPLLKAFEDHTNVRMIDLWGQLYFAIYKGHEKNLEFVESEEEKKKVEKDFILLTKELKPEVFKANKNPLDITFRMVESATEPDVYYPMKPSCCLYYQIDGVQRKCYTCPRIKDEEREQRKQEIIARLRA